MTNLQNKLLILVFSEFSISNQFRNNSQFPYLLRNTYINTYIIIPIRRRIVCIMFCSLKHESSSLEGHLALFLLQVKDESFKSFTEEETSFVVNLFFWCLQLHFFFEQLEIHASLEPNNWDMVDKSSNPEFLLRAKTFRIVSL